VITVVSLSPIPALAQPPAQPAPPTNVSDALKQYQDLSTQAEKANEDLLAATNDLTNKTNDLNKATSDLAKAQGDEKQALAQEDQFRGKVDALASASFQGARFNNLSALLTGGSQQDFLDRASALSVLASDNKDALDKFTSAVDKAAASRKGAADAQHRAQDAKTAAEALQKQMARAKSDLDAKKGVAEAAYKKLSGKDKADLAAPSQGVFLAPPGAAHDAVQVALNQVGKWYVYGAAGPNTFDCSGLVMFAYRAAGVSLPHSSRAQYGFGKSVAYGQWVSCDLLFFGGSAGSIHHVAMYIGDGKIVHASTSGQPVKVVPVSGGGSDYFGAKRIVG